VTVWFVKSSTLGEADDEITDILWTWKQSIYGNDTEATPPKPKTTQSGLVG
jgi:hypothetical protein